MLKNIVVRLKNGMNIAFFWSKFVCELYHFQPIYTLNHPWISSMFCYLLFSPFLKLSLKLYWMLPQVVDKELLVAVNGLYARFLSQFKINLSSYQKTDRLCKISLNSSPKWPQNDPKKGLFWASNGFESILIYFFHFILSR